MLLKDTTTKKKEIVNFFISKNMIINSSVLERLNDEQLVSQLHEAISSQDITQPILQAQLTSIIQNKLVLSEQPAVKVVFDYEDKHKKKQCKTS